MLVPKSVVVDNLDFGRTQNRIFIHVSLLEYCQNSFIFLVIGDRKTHV